MEHYTLQADETMLYHGDVYVKRAPNEKVTRSDFHTELLLTNKSIVLSNKRRHFLSRSTMEATVYSVSDIKTYEGTVQVIRKKNNVDIFLTDKELFLCFPKGSAAKEFTDKALRLVSGYSKVVRGVKKMQKAVTETNEALDINLQSAVVSTAKFTAQVAMGIAGEETTKSAGIVAKLLTHKRKKKDSTSLPAPKDKL